jgi:hypothetical protein
MDDADAFAAFAAMVLVAEGDESVPVLKSDSARGLEARRGEAQELVCVVLSYHRPSRRPSALAAELGGMLDDRSGFKAKFLGAR